jgi:pilus assembly protein CpaB
VIGRTATLELGPRQAEKLALGQQVGTISLALRSIIDTAKTDEPEETGQRQSINVVRYGISTIKTVQ